MFRDGVKSFSVIGEPSVWILTVGEISLSSVHKYKCMFNVILIKIWGNQCQPYCEITSARTHFHLLRLE